MKDDYVRDWAKTASFYVGLAWSEKHNGLPDMFEIGSSLMFRWYMSCGSPKAQIVEARRKDHWLGYRSISGRDPLVLCGLRRGAVSDGTIEAIEAIIKEVFPGIVIPVCQGCGGRFGLDEIGDAHYCQDCIGSLRPDKLAGFIYIFGSRVAGYYKIGMGQNPLSRMRDYQNSKLPFPVQIIHRFPTDNQREAEKELHRLMGEQRVNGEWFRLTPEQLQGVMRIKGYQSGMFHVAELT